MKGLHPVRRTLQHLNDTRLILKPFVRIVSVNYNTRLENSEGAKQFVYWHLGKIMDKPLFLVIFLISLISLFVAQLQYKNPEVQVITFTDLTPSPFIRVFFNSGKDLLLDIDRQSKDEIHNRIVKSLCKTQEGI